MKARHAATEEGLAIARVIGILDQAAASQLIDLPSAVERLRNTSFWASDRLLQQLLIRHA